ncbi:ATP-binding cassette domain-containing protein [Streptomyces leeuwenhoekii]|uniref:ATP-binding cassette domain-containing protein n=2 Tax=Streptomyces leeuwenhoekii TaxID=1437453 RepID=UPI00063D93DF|nr:ATP-binding cassette domain-containing protein [Streptomyces leeuwenhoekii]
MIQALGLTSNPRKELPPALDDVSFEAVAGRVTALLGAPGAGKTTALRLMLELQQGRGVTYFRGRPLHRIAHPSREVGVLLGDVPGHPARTVRGHLRMLCAAAGVPARRADEVLEAVGLVSLRDERLGTLSRGMDRRLGLACALLADPHTLVLDAPADGLSTREARWLHDTLRTYAAQGGTVLFTTPDPKEAARTADRVVTLERGRLVADQEAADFARTRLRPRVAVRSPHAARLAALIAKEARTARRSVEVVREGGNRLSVYGSTCADIGEIAFRHGILVHQLADEIGDMGPGAGVAPPAPVHAVHSGPAAAQGHGDGQGLRLAGDRRTEPHPDEVRERPSGGHVPRGRPPADAAEASSGPPDRETGTPGEAEPRPDTDAAPNPRPTTAHSSPAATYPVSDRAGINPPPVRDPAGSEAPGEGPDPVEAEVPGASPGPAEPEDVPGQGADPAEPEVPGEVPDPVEAEAPGASPGLAEAAVPGASHGPVEPEVPGASPDPAEPEVSGEGPDPENAPTARTPAVPAAAAPDAGAPRTKATAAESASRSAPAPFVPPATPLPPLPPPISVRSAPSPLRPLRYELRRAAGIGTGFLTAAAVLAVSAVAAVLLARIGHTPQPRLLAAWPKELPLPPAAVGAGLLGALSFGDEFRHPALAADRGTVPRRLGLLAAKLAVSGATALLLAVLTVGCDAEVLYLFYGRELIQVPADWLPLGAGWIGLVVGCAWAGVLAAGVFRSTTAGLAAVVAVPVLVLPFVQKVWEGPSVRTAAGLPMRLREALLSQWPFGGERYLAALLRLLGQPVGSALTLSLTALLCAYLLTNLRSKAR